MADDTPNLFDWLAAELAKDAAIAQVASVLDPHWERCSQWAIITVASQQPQFTSDDVWQVLWDMAIPAPAEPRAMGYALQRAQRNGICAPTGGYVRSQRPVAHCRPMRVWASKVWNPCEE